MRAGPSGGGGSGGCRRRLGAGTPSWPAWARNLHHAHSLGMLMPTILLARRQCRGRSLMIASRGDEGGAFAPRARAEAAPTPLTALLSARRCVADRLPGRSGRQPPDRLHEAGRSATLPVLSRSPACDPTSARSLAPTIPQRAIPSSTPRSAWLTAPPNPATGSVVCQQASLDDRMLVSPGPCQATSRSVARWWSMPARIVRP